MAEIKMGKDSSEDRPKFFLNLPAEQEKKVFCHVRFDSFGEESFAVPEGER
jgi:hypothetical protein